MRTNFVKSLCELAAKHDDIFLICGDLGYSVLETFAESFPDRYLNAGIAEQNMTQVAAGLSREGYNVFTYSIGNFPTLRCMEQIRYDVCYHEANVKIVSVGAGYAYGPQGVSHHTTEDIAMLRSLPNMLVCSPADPAEAQAAARFMANHRGPGYVRLNKAGEPPLRPIEQSLKLRPGRFRQLRKGNGTAVLATGAIVGDALSELDKSGDDWSVYSAPFIGKYETDVLRMLAEQYESIITLEEHQLSGGFGSSLVEEFSDLYAKGLLTRMPRIKRVGIADRFIGVSGTQEYLRKVAGLTIGSEPA
ncbi:transketolase family protein [Agrobacterium sp. Azo12]|uniref:transketolase family protein n=1 Tax=Agrobacterium sp. Azo12 TaxID=3031129 RepID=UPI0023D8A83D|nr:transketolase C-terminal domain-containing protein [Agrobacterium sp. Azo12]MDO5896965.1 transketolase C-terminal domain-containing protein [Agrobacterium sp. Azo12]